MGHGMGADLHQPGVRHFPKLAPGTRGVFSSSTFWSGNRHAHALIQTAGHRFNTCIAILWPHSIQRAKNAVEFAGCKLIGRPGLLTQPEDLVGPDPVFSADE